jgi:chromosome segregation ATPase
MQPMPRFEATAPTKLHALISDLRRRVQFLDADIEEEERKSRVFDPANHSYSMLALTLRERRGNLQTTVATLQKQLETVLHPASERAA